MRIGILGGTFDPPHVGHLIIAEQACVQLKLDTVVFIPAYLPPHKSGSPSASGLDRLAMTRLAVRGNPSLTVSDREVKRGGVSYTIDTLKELRQRYPDARFFLIIGEDNYKTFDTWKDYRHIANLASLVVYRREDKQRGVNRHTAVIWLDGPLVSVSSSMIRSYLRNARSVRYLVPESVARYIRKKRLYRATRR